MHEHGLVTRLIDLAKREASSRGGTLRSVRVRLGALSSSDPEHFAEEFAHVCEEHGLGEIGLWLEVDSERPTGIELISIELMSP